MLQSIRDRTQGWIAGVIISLVILSFALWGIHSYIEGYSNTDIIAKVGGVNITKRELSAAYERVRRQTQVNNTNGSVSEGTENNLKQRALEALINIQVLKQASINENYKISIHQVDNYLESMPEFQVNGQCSPPRYIRPWIF
jgi:peptidyl-prolyl cis-trans isomerase D